MEFFAAIKQVIKEYARLQKCLERGEKKENKPVYYVFVVENTCAYKIAFAAWPVWQGGVCPMHQGVAGSRA